MAEEASRMTRVFLGVGAVAASLLIFGFSFSHYHYRDGLAVVIRAKNGKYLEVGEDGLLRATAPFANVTAARFRLVALSHSTISVLKPAQVHLTQVGKLGCACNGFSDEHGFGRFCHAWESSHHQPWCYVDSTCKKGVRAKRYAHMFERFLQVCRSEEGYLGPEGWKEPQEPGCGCTGSESVHGFGSYCRGWEFVGQTPWCYTGDDCASASGQPGAKFQDCVSNVTSPPPPSPLPPSPPPPPLPPPLSIIESNDGWGTPEGCPCSKYSNKHGFGAYCKGWEVEGQTPWCYVSDSCTVPTKGGSFQHPYITCLPTGAKTSAAAAVASSAGLLSSLFGRRLANTAASDYMYGEGGQARTKGATPTHSHSHSHTHSHTHSVAHSSSKSPSKPITPGSAVHKPVPLKAPMLPGHTAPTSSHFKLAPKKSGTSHLEAMRKALLAVAGRMPRYALRSERTKGYVSIEGPPHKDAFFAHASAEIPSLSATFALPSSWKGKLINVGAPAFLSLCYRPESDGVVDPTKPYACAAGPPLHKPPRSSKPHMSHEFHRRFLLSSVGQAYSEFELEIAP